MGGGVKSRRVGRVCGAEVTARLVAADRCVEIGWMEQAVLIISGRFICLVFLITRITVDWVNHNNSFFEYYLIGMFRPNVPSITLARMRDSIHSFERNFPGYPLILQANVGMIPGS
jgi:hypothetical protein